MQASTAGPWTSGRKLADRGFFHGLKRRVMATIAAIAAGSLFVVLYLGFLATRYPWYSNVAVVVSVLILVPTVIAALWIHWGLSLGHRAMRGFDRPDW